LYNTADIDTGTQNPDLRLKKLKMRVIPRTKPLQDEGQERDEEVFHTDTFRSAKPAQRRENTWYQDSLHFRTPKPGDLATVSLEVLIGFKTQGRCGSLCATFFEEHVPDVQHVDHI
jgi:hypothetical protein